jgi:hypothetical protein
MSPVSLPNLAGKIVYVYQQNREHEVVLQDAGFEEHNGRFFLTGVVPEGCSENDWLMDLKVYVAWDWVQEFIVFDSLEEYYARLARAWSDHQLQ